MSRTIPIIVVAAAFELALGSQLAQAQAQLQPPKGAVVTSSEPGKASAVAVAEATATVVAVNRATRVVTLKVPSGRTLDVVCGDEVRNFAQIHVGDLVKVSYREALSLKLKKAGRPSDATATTAVARAEPGSQPAGALGVEVNILADVVAVDPKKMLISLRGPAGNVVDLKVQNPDHFKVVKKGDQVEVLYSQALAISVTPMPKAAGGKK